MKSPVQLHAKIEAKSDLATKSHSVGAYAGLIFVTLLFAGGWLVGTKKYSKEALLEKRTQFLVEFQKTLQAHQIESTVIAQEGVLRISTKNVVFPVGSENPPPEQTKNIDTIAAVLAKALSCSVDSNLPAVEIQNAVLPEGGMCEQPSEINFDCARGAHQKWNAVLIQGHADARPIQNHRNYLDNLALSGARSHALMRQMYRCSPQLMVFHNADGLPLLNAASYSTQRPANLQDNLADENRRMELRFIVNGL